jgi:predicted ATPase/class 3 adenylate cyclase
MAETDVILTPDQRVRVFVSSTLGELAGERAAALRAIRRLRLVPVWYESGARPHPPRAMYRAYLAQSQVFVGIYWQRYGWVAPGMGVSGLEDEFRLAAGKPMLLYLKRPAPAIDPRLAAMIDGIREAGTVSYRTFGTPRELERLLAEDLAVLLSESFAGAAAGGETSPGELAGSAGSDLPAGTVTFLLTDIEGSTRLWETVPEAMEEALERHDRLLGAVIGDHSGRVVTSRGEGDSFFAVFAGAVAAVEAAGACQRRLNAAWPAGAALRVRMGLHTGEARVRGSDRIDHAPINRCARVKAAARGGQVLVTRATRDLVQGRLGGGFGLKRLGEFRLRDLAEPELIYQLTHADLPADFPPIRTLAQRTSNLPVPVSSFIGRERELEQAVAAVGQARLVTLTGPGGIGKTRLAVAAGDRLGDRFAAGVVFVPLAAITDPALVLADVGRAVGAGLGGAGSPLQALAEWFGGDRWLLILDNLEQVVSAAGELGELLARCPGVTILATSRTVLGLAAEREYPVPPLPLPAGADAVPVDELAASPAVALFVDRARAVRPGFALTESNAAAVAEICRRLEGLPLAIELAAARTRLLDPAGLLARLAVSLDTLGTGAVDLPARQRTLRATVQWSVGLLEDRERSLLETLAVFTGGWTVEAAAQVAGLGEDRALALLEALARHSLIQLDSTGPGPRCAMLETVRAFVAERLAARPDAAEVQRRHAEYYRGLAGQADRPLRGAGQGEWLERLEAEAGNLAAAVHWYLACEPTPLPHLFRILWPFWYLRDRQAQARPWVEELLPAAASLDPQARAELEWAATVTANEVGEDAAALAARRRLEPLIAEIQDSFLRGICHLGIAWTSPINGDFEGALRELSASLEELHAPEEPFYTALAAFTAGAAETALGRPDGALRHLAVMRELADRFGYAWLTASARLQLGTLAIGQGRPGQARELLDEALDLSLEIRIIRNVTLCLTAFAQLAFAEGDPNRAALLAGAAEGLRSRAGFSTWPMLRRSEADLAAQIRQALGDDRFGQVFAAGSRLTQQQAVAAIRDQPSDHTQPS